ncbi:MAG: hypothetical protein JNM76_15205 [Betaproteobacteria bacterium]|nr:hypothetical protein [Betaproteobacteria bacterium]
MPHKLSVSVMFGALFLAASHLGWAQNPASTAMPSKFAQPPGAETALIGKLIDESEALYKAGASASEVLSNAKFDAARAWPRFRSGVRRSAKAAPLTLVSQSEAGVQLVVRGRLIDATGKGVPGALVYVYHTDSRGLYAEDAIHVAGDSGDWKHARLFGYLKTGAEGEFQLRTIRPAGYPGSDLPQHIHFGVEDEALRISAEIGFDDDPRLGPAARVRFQSRGNVVARVTRDAEGNHVAVVEVALR